METVAVGEYRLIARLGRGGMADVFLAVRRGIVGFTKLLVVKRLRDDLVEHAQASRYRTLLLDEAALAARLEHPNIVQTFEVGEDAGVPFIAMEYLDGQPLHRVLNQARRAGTEVPLALALRIVADVLGALDYAHRLTDFDGTPLRVVHRDVSPHNVFWTYDGELKLVDFGVAKFALGRDHTEAGVVKGKLEYMAPEQARGAEIDGRTDVFATGVLMWELITGGRRLLRGKTQAESLQRLLFEPLPSPATCKPDLDPELVRICERALERDPERRYPTAGAMRAELERVLDPRAGQRADLAAFVAPLFEGERRAVAEQIRTAMRSERRSLITLPHPRVTSTELHESDLIPTTADGGAPATVARPRSGRSWLVPALVAAVVAVGIAITALGLRDHRDVAVAAAPAAVLPAAPPPAPPALRLCGSNTVGAELAPALVEAFLRRGGAPAVARDRSDRALRLTATVDGREVRIEITAAGTGTAFEGLAAGTCDVGMASRAINDAEAAALAQAGLGDVRAPATEHVIALDGIAVIVHPNNKLRALDRDALRDVFTGEIADWSALGGAPAPITVFARDHHSGTFDTFKHLVLGKAELAPAARRFEQSEALANEVASDPAAIGFIGLAYVRSAKAIAVGDRGTPAMLPTSFTVTTEGYMLARRLYLYTPPKPRSPLVADLVSFALSSQGQQAVRAAGFVDLDIVSTAPAPCDARCPPRYAALVRGARRLSLDLRFRYASDEVDSRATRDLDRLVHFLQVHPGGQILLLGFSDSSGSAAQNLRLSKERAAKIAAELASRGVRAAAIDGFGAALPVTSNRSDADRERNRRVEVWLGP